MRALMISILVFAGAPALADDTKEQQTAETKDCTSCTARHKSLQALQQARVPAEKEPEADKDPKDE